MKIAVKIVLALVILIIGSGYAMKYLKLDNHEVVIGIGVLMLAFVLIPLFLIQRMKDKNLMKYIDGSMIEQEKPEETKPDEKN